MVFEPRSKDGTLMTRMRRIIAGSFESVDKTLGTDCTDCTELYFILYPNGYNLSV